MVQSKGPGRGWVGKWFLVYVTCYFINIGIGLRVAQHDPTSDPPAMTGQPTLLTFGKS